MPIIKSAIKRMHQTAKRRARNMSTKRNLRVAVKAFMASKSNEELRKAQSEIDTAVKKNILSKNTAARKKAQLARLAKEASATTEAPKKTVKKATTTKKPAAKTTKKAAPKKTQSK